MPTTVLVRNEAHDKGARSGNWAVLVNGRKESSHRLKRVALRKARQKARGRSPAVLKVQATNGQWRTEASYA